MRISNQLERRYVRMGSAMCASATIREALCAHEEVLCAHQPLCAHEEVLCAHQQSIDEVLCAHQQLLERRYKRMRKCYESISRYERMRNRYVRIGNQFMRCYERMGKLMLSRSASKRFSWRSIASIPELTVRKSDMNNSVNFNEPV